MTQRKFFLFQVPIRGSGHGLDVVNFRNLLRPGHLMIIGPDGRLPPFPETPILAPKKGSRFKPPKDLSMCMGVMFVSQKLKDVIETIDPEAAEFSPIEIHYPKGKAPSSPYYFFAVRRQIDALDLDRSRLRILDDKGNQIYDLLGKHNLHFDEQRAGSAHLFKQKHLPGLVADSVLKEACLAAGIKDYEMFGKLTNMRPGEPRTGITYQPYY
ncbi:DUF1629 domain-containing protein [Neorhizobium sp. P12A]|uniref:imm11 family protein n=1 Tax=Neorhizobium sp. P12A TaxID=2268027 RepID=UPI0011EC98B8|nr:DUF1629 domain-containing protein [Neorhizobium sp. P12A]KAA0697394.1 DUF1629 domain-containing protein [Neorhizobium sp. P12A]